MKRRLLQYCLISFSILCFPLISKAQYAESIVSGRPGNANGPLCVGKGVYQIQMGQNFVSTKNSLSDNYKGFYSTQRVINGPDVMIRVGIKEDFELRLGSSYNFADEVSFENGSSTNISGLNSLNLGFRHTVFYQKGVLPFVALQFSTELGGSNEYDKKLPDANLRLNLANNIGKKLHLNWNFISRWQTESAAISGFYIFSFSYPLTDQLSISLEGFGDIDETTKLNGGLGLAYILGNDFQFDLYGSYGMNEIERGNVQQEVIAINGGISYRIVRRGE